MTVINSVQYAFDGIRGNTAIDVYRFFTYTAAGVFADKSTEARTSYSTSDPITIDNAVGACWYFAANPATPFHALLVSLATLGVTAAPPSLAWEYWNGSAWAALTMTDAAAPINLTATDNLFHWAIPSDWADTSVNGTSARWVRARVIATFTTAPAMRFISVGRTVAWSKVINLPHNAMTWQSVWLDWSGHLNNRYGAVKGVSVYARFNSGAWRSITGPITGYSGTDNQLSVRNLVDLISAFKLDWPGGSNVTLELRFAVVAIPSNASVDYISDLAGRINATYAFDEAEANDIRTKTVRIPLRSLPAGLTTTEQLVDTIPALDTWLPEASKSIQDWWIEIEGNSCNNAADTATYGFRARVGSLSSVLAYNCANTTHSSPYHWAIYNLMGLGLDTAATQDVYLRSTQANNLANQANAVVHVTYNYSKAATTRTLQSLVIPLTYTAMPLRTSDAANADGQQANVSRPIWIQEPGTITVKKSGMRLIMEELTYGAIAQSVRVKASGDTAFTAYPTGPRGTPAGQYSIMHPLSGLTLGRGKNFVEAAFYSQYDDYIFRGRSHVLYLNYESDVHPDGEWRHNKTISTLLVNMGYIESTWSTYKTFCPMGQSEQTSYFINDASIELLETGQVPQAMPLVATVYNDTTQHNALQTNLEHAGPIRFLSGEYTAHYFIPTLEWFSQISDGIKPLTPQTGRLRPYIGNGYGVIATAKSLKSAVGLTTFHCCGKSVSGRVRGMPGNPLEAMLISTEINDANCHMKPITINDDGTFTTSWPDDGADVYVVAHYDGNHHDVSQRNKAGTP
jgi:plastocyanin